MLKLSLLLLLGLLLNGCGKKLDKQTEYLPSPDDDEYVPNSFITEQQVYCDDEFNCPEFVAKILVVDTDKIRYCTGTLVRPDMIVTSANCLPRRFKVSNTKCDKNVFFFFPRTSVRTASMERCDVVYSIDRGVGDEQALWSKDIAFLKLKTVPARLPAQMSESPLNAGVAYNAWSVVYENDLIGKIIKRDCKAITNSFYNPFASTTNAPFLPFGGCELSEGETGAVVLDHNGAASAVLSVNSGPEIGRYFMNSDLATEEVEIVGHGTNLRCLSFPWERFGQKRADICGRTLSSEDLDKERAKILSEIPLNLESLRDLEERLSHETQYLRWSLRLMPNVEDKSATVHLGRPYCFEKLDAWIWGFASRRGNLYTLANYRQTIKNYKYLIRFNRYLNPVYTLTEDGMRDYSISFSPADLWMRKFSDIKVQFGLGSGNFEDEYSVNEQCIQREMLSSN